MQKIGLTSNLFASPKISVSGLSSEYETYLLGGKINGSNVPNRSLQIKQNKCFIELKQSGIWDKMDVLYLFTGNDASMKIFSKVNAKDPLQFFITENQSVGNTLLYENKGWSFPGITSDLTTNFNPALATFNYTVNSAGRYGWIIDYSNSFGVFDANAGGINNFSFTSLGSNSRINQGGNLDSLNILGHLGYFSICRGSSAGYEVYSNLIQHPITRASVSPLSSSVQLLGRISTTAANQTHGFYAMGGYLTQAENQLFYEIMLQYFISTGIPIPIVSI